MIQRGSLEFQGCHLAWRIDGTGPRLVMIQGVGAAGTSPNPQIERLAKHYSCLSFDNRGIGASQPAGRKLSVAQMAADTAALMDHLGWNSAHIVAHSLGGLMAAQLALDDRARVRSLSLLCSFARGSDVRMTAWIVWILLRMRLGPRKIRQDAFMDLVLPPGHPEMHSAGMSRKLSGIVGHDIADAPPITSEQVKALRHADVSARLHELAGIPTLVINGDKDLIAPPKLGRALAAGIPGARFFEIAGAAHSFPVIEPDRCAELILDHLSKLEE